MPNTFTQRRAEQYARFTGLGYHKALARVAALKPGEAPLPPAQGAQRLLEGRVFTHLGGDVDYFPHPVGIAAVHPGPTSITVVLDSSETRHGHPLARHAIEGLLPVELPDSIESADPLHGVRGLRVAAVTRHALHLTLVGTRARLTLTSSGDTDWREVLRWRAAGLREAGARPCWDQPRMTSAEELFEHDHPTLCQAEDEAAWLPSGLLRRVGLLHTVSTAYCTRYWLTVDEWRFELRHEYGVPMPHDTFIAHLTDPRWGLPLTVDKHHCDCGAPWLDPKYDQQCTIELSHREQVPGELQLRFRTNYKSYSNRDTLARLRTVQADPAWLRRVLPSHLAGAEQPTA
ncbi:hypothetical protein [Streptomyces millisiae]|uniref:Uncharacterized protein n=1 Tax=Streptomyces millisiae TaxID=3075542 RepID=A0ABU2LZZ2_9ACTN|nr:hypothetical protein [Streptomyces sp. DSM 44918]MDT0323153.1 hypothetical protein [Streptomyces sp. DSM 44918]